MNTTIIEAQARYLIEDRIHPTHPQPPASGLRRRARKVRKLSWL
jgi:hypothetical protein